jgi:hypothetical protein
MVFQLNKHYPFYTNEEYSPHVKKNFFLFILSVFKNIFIFKLKYKIIDKSLKVFLYLKKYNHKVMDIFTI